MTLEDVPYRGVPQHVTLVASTVAIIDLESDFPAVEIAALDGTVTVLVDPSDTEAPTATSGHIILTGSALALRSGDASTGPGGVTRVKVLGAPTETPRIIVTGLR